MSQMRRLRLATRLKFCNFPSANLPSLTAYSSRYVVDVVFALGSVLSNFDSKSLRLASNTMQDNQYNVSSRVEVYWFLRLVLVLVAMASNG
jgi:hypothetical protein